MTDWVVTANLAGPKASAEVKESTYAWGISALERRPAIAFVQEVPSDEWLTPWRVAGYTVTLGAERGWTVRSAVLTRKDLAVARLTPDDCANLHYHGEYVAAARWDSARGPVVLASVHASPNEADPSGYGWTGALPEPRDGGGDPRHVGGRLWDSDLVLATLARLTQHGSTPVLAAGDLNEAVGYDFDGTGHQLGTWGAEFFKRARELGFSPWLSDVWGAERATRGAWQLDHVLLSGAAESLLAKEPEPHLDPLWTSSEEVGLSDHTPIWATIDGGI